MVERAGLNEPCFSVVSWPEGGQVQSARWRAENGAPAPQRLQLADDTLSADAAFRLMSEGTSLVWRGDFQNARQLVQAVARRIDRKPRKPTATLTEAFHQHRQFQAQRARTLGRVLIPLAGDYGISLRRAPDVKPACSEAWGEPDGQPSLVSLRELLGVIGAHEWRKNGVEIPALGSGESGARIHPHYGVFSPVRGEYLKLLADAPLPSLERAFDIGTGTGVIAALLTKRGVRHVVATDRDPRALVCARANLKRLGCAGSVKVIDADLFPEGRAPLVVCNPPWLPARANSPLEHAIYDPDSRMLKGFLNGLTAHLEAGGEGWLILSDLAERLGLRAPDFLQNAIAAAGLKVLARHDTRPTHPRVHDETDPLHAARAAEITSLWRLAAA